MVEVKQKKAHIGALIELIVDEKNLVDEKIMDENSHNKVLELYNRNCNWKSETMA